MRTIGRRLAVRLQRWIPEPFVFAIVLTLFVAALAVGVTGVGADALLQAWYKGFWSLLEFGMQMVLILTTGSAIALSPVVSRLLDRLAGLARTPATVYVLILIVGGLFCLVSWGWVAITAVLARELARRVKGVDYAYLVACVYLSQQTWCAGLSSSIPLVLNTEGNFLIETGVLADRIPVAATLGSALNWAYIASYFAGVPALMWWMRPKGETGPSLADLREADHLPAERSVAEEAAALNLTGSTPSDRLNNSRLLSASIGIAALVYVTRRFVANGLDLDLNIMVFTFLAVGMLAHATPMRYVVAMKRACSNVSGIIYQYPFYAGVMGIMTFTGLGTEISEWMASVADVGTLPVLAQLYAALVNMAIPSGGGEWAVIGPALTETAQTLTVGALPTETTAFIARVAMAVAYGETSTNLLQPFFLLLVLPVMGAGVRIQARDLMGYLVVPFVYMLVTTAVLVSVVPL